MFSFFKKKSKVDPTALPELQHETPPAVPEASNTECAPPLPESTQNADTPKRSWLDRLTNKEAEASTPPVSEQAIPEVIAPPQPIAPLPVEKPTPAVVPLPTPPIVASPAPAAILEAEEYEEEIVIPAAVAAEQKRSWLTRLKTGLSKTSSNLTTLFIGAKIDDALYEELESALLVSDAGVEATQYLLNALKKKVKDERLTEAPQVKTALRSLLIALLTPLQKPMAIGKHQPLVMMIAGVNGAGKTTTIGKLAKHLQAHKQSVLLAAGDTFRAAAREQLTIWGERNNVSVIAQESGDPAAVAFDAVHSAQARGTNVVMVDTAGRLPTQLHLMDELKKVKRVIAKGMASAPHEILLVIDGNTGQNALTQVKAFDDALGLTGLVITKLDGTAKGGILAAIAITRAIPVYFIGVGEQIEDLQPFDATDFVDALLR
ncbi:signal recognition particle-docking protein FtsY [Glaciimonas sp. PCH181]|uniref:signal recognition particle-docking protein FtsY n=1 Tax=Glaciimonas sp. PCH181 TaxID=2133943 RepID=UPI000D33B0A3|nr:signal recognition particle-docking protein FtsY [Glaciimonas sp. PCH181]PUA17371.1 signal recognition particle-docking protein FtsY [Glaciimonas sp. PCH181]